MVPGAARGKTDIGRVRGQRVDSFRQVDDASWSRAANIHDFARRSFRRNRAENAVDRIVHECKIARLLPRASHDKRVTAKSQGKKIWNDVAIFAGPLAGSIDIEQAD